MLYCTSGSLQEKAKIVNKNKVPLEQGGRTQRHMEEVSLFIAALLNHKTLGHFNTLLFTVLFLLPSPMQEKTPGYIIIMIGIIPCCMHHSVQHAILSSPMGMIHLVSINSISFIDSFFSLVHCLYWKGSQETCFSTEPNIFSLLFLNV